MAKKRGVPLGEISEMILHRGTVPRVFGFRALADWVRLSQVRRSTWVSAPQRSVSMRPLQTPDLHDGGNGAAQDPYAAESLVSDVLSGLLR